jgi:hypothetical protein
MSSNFPELQRRIKARLLELGENPTALATRHGLWPGYIRDFLVEKPRRRTIKSDKLAQVAAALDVDEGYLTLAQSMPRKDKGGAVEGTQMAHRRIRFGGRTAVGRWNAAPVETSIPLLPSISAPGLNVDVAFVQEDETLAGKGIHAGMVLYAEMAAKSEPGDIVIIRRTMGPLVELSARVKGAAGRYELAPPPGFPEIAEPKRSQFQETEEAVVRIAQRFFK